MSARDAAAGLREPVEHFDQLHRVVVDGHRR